LEARAFTSPLPRNADGSLSLRLPTARLPEAPAAAGAGPVPVGASTAALRQRLKHAVHRSRASQHGLQAPLCTPCSAGAGTPKPGNTTATPRAPAATAGEGHGPAVLCPRVAAGLQCHLALPRGIFGHASDVSSFKRLAAHCTSAGDGHGETGGEVSAEDALRQGVVQCPACGSRFSAVGS
jgi:hypothetical protein